MQCIIRGSQIIFCTSAPDEQLYPPYFPGSAFATDSTALAQSNSIAATIAIEHTAKNALSHCCTDSAAPADFLIAITTGDSWETGGQHTGPA